MARGDKDQEEGQVSPEMEEPSRQMTAKEQDAEEAKRLIGESRELVDKINSDSKLLVQTLTAADARTDANMYYMIEQAQALQRKADSLRSKML